MTTERETIDSFLAGKRVLFVGLSATPTDFSRAVWKELVEHGYDVTGVNPHGGEIEGRAVFPSVEAAEGEFDFAIVMTPPPASEGVVRACAARGLRRVWLHRGAGEGSVSDAAVSAGRELGLEMVVGRCPLMFLEPTLAVHRVHGQLLDLAGRYPLRPGEPSSSLRLHLPWALSAGLAAALVVFLLRPFVLLGLSAGETGVAATMVGLFATVLVLGLRLRKTGAEGR